MSGNDGNTGRRAFSDPDTFSLITGVDRALIVRFAVILRPLASQRPVHPDKFAKYALTTAVHFRDLYPCFYMPVSLHKLLIQCADVIRSHLLPIGMFSEEIQEARSI